MKEVYRAYYDREQFEHGSWRITKGTYHGEDDRYILYAWDKRPMNVIKVPKKEIFETLDAVKECALIDLQTRLDEIEDTMQTVRDLRPQDV